MSMISTVGLAFYVMAMPFITYFMLKNNFSFLSKESFQARFGSLYEGLDLRNVYSVMHSVVFFVRRLLFSFSIVFFGEVPLLQATLQIIMSMSLIVYMLLFKPFKKKKTFYYELYNEGTLLTCSYFLMVFCDILMDSEIRYNVGWFMTTATLINLFTNYMNLVVSMIKKVCKKCKAFLDKRKQK